MKKFDQQLAALRQRVLDMGELCQTMVETAIKGLSDPRTNGFESVMVSEEQVDQMQVEIDQEAINLMTVYGPVAANLRFLLMVSRINNELERIGDQAVNMCEDLRLMASKTDAAPPPEIHKMASLVEGMVNDSLRAFFDEDIQKAQHTLATDDLVDAINDQIISELLDQQAVRSALTDPSQIGGALALILIARSLERIADLATNICEEVVYIVQGADIRHKESLASASE